MVKTWTEQHIVFMQDNYASMAIDDITKALGKTKNAGRGHQITGCANQLTVVT